jgi:hypothetical protein
MSGDKQVNGFFRPYSFPATTPLVGGLIARLRSAWYGVAARWALADLQAQLSLFATTVGEQLVALDRSQVAQTHDIGELTAQVARMNELLTDIDARLARLESAATQETDQEG